MFLKGAWKLAILRDSQKEGGSMLNDNLFKTEKVLSLLPRAKPEIIRRVVEATKNFQGFGQ